jgi:hypothetical protein
VTARRPVTAAQETDLCGTLRRECRPIQIMPIARPRGLSALFLRLRYWAIALFAVMVFAGLVSAGFILIGVILISYQETKDLAGSVQVWLRNPDGAVIIAGC